MPSKVPARDQDLYAMYLNDVGRYPLLSSEEELSLAQLIAAGEEARATLERSSDLELDQRRWLERAAWRGDEARQKFVECNLRLVVMISSKYRSFGVPMLDLIQEGNIGLMHAVGKFDWRMGFKFSTYATWWIRQAMERCVNDTRSTVRVPRQTASAAARVGPMRAELQARLGRVPTYAELADALSMTTDRLTGSLRFAQTLASLSAPLTEGGASIEEIISDPTVEAPFDRAAAALMPAAVEALLAPLDERERNIISLRYGLDGGKPRTLAEVARFYPLTRERIRQIEKQALARLRKSAVETNVREALNA